MATDAIEREIQAAYLRLKQAEATIRFCYDHYLDDLGPVYEQRLAALEAGHAAAREQAQADHAARLEAARTSSLTAGEWLRTQLAEITAAFPWATAGWDDPIWQAYAPASDAPVPRGVRIGRLDLGDAAELPPFLALARFVGAGHLFVAGDAATLPVAHTLLHTIVLRLIAATTPGTIRLTLADPVGQGQRLAAFLRLPDTLRGEKVYARPEEIERQLGSLASHVEEVIQTRLLNLYPTVEAYNEQTSGVAVSYHVLVLPDFPAGFSDRMAEQLLAIARNGPRAGVYIVAALNPGYEAPRTFDLSEITRLGTMLRLTGDDRLAWDDPDFGAHPVIVDTPPPPEQVNALLSAVGAAAQEAPTSLSFERIAIPAHERWAGSSIEGLRVPIGVNAKGEPHALELGKGVVYHGLIGGIIRSGKSNLLHVLITQLALRYPPEELELYLVDLKVGVEFQNYLAYRLPHARIIALEGEPEFGLSVLRRLRSEIETRAKRFPPLVSNLTEYRLQTGERLPRILLVMDEFQVLFRDEDRVATEAGRLLEDVARRGAAFGLHLLLCSQSPSGGPMYGRRIYDQMGLRIALQCRPADAQAILGEGNDAANRLERPGEAIYNDDRGLKERNVFVRTALLPAADRQRYLETIQDLAGDRAYPAPITFQGRAPALLQDNPELQAQLAQADVIGPSGSAKVWLGEPIEIGPPTAATLERYMRSNLLIAGGDEAEGYGLLLAALLSLASQHAPEDAVFVAADFARHDAPVAGLFARLKEGLPHRIDGVGPREAGSTLSELLTALEERIAGNAPSSPTVYYMIAGLQRWRELRATDQYGQPGEEAKRLARLVDEGPEVGIHVIAWVDGFTIIERALKRGGVGGFDLRAVLRVPETDSAALLGSPVAARLEDNRALFRHEDWELGRVEKFKPYAIPEPEALTVLIEAVAAKTGSLTGGGA